MHPCGRAPAVAALGLLLLAALPGDARAHPGYTLSGNAEVRRDGTFSVEMFVHRESLPGGFGEGAPPVAVEGLPGDPGVRAQVFGVLGGFAVLFDGRPAPWKASWPLPQRAGHLRLLLAGDVPEGAGTLDFRNDGRVAPWAVAVRHEGMEEAEFFAPTPDRPSPPVSLRDGFAPRGALPTLLRFTALGFEHILPRGLDHILFVIGLFLLAARWKPLLAQVSAFTAAHTLTLALAATGTFRLPPAVVEPLIAASIVYVAVENLCTQEVRPRRMLLVFGFGLLHGLGFAGVLVDLGLPAGRRALALISFNAGVELGQIAVLAAAWLLLAAPFRAKAWYRSRVVVPASVGIALVGAAWFVQRLLAA